MRKNAIFLSNDTKKYCSHKKTKKINDIIESIFFIFLQPKIFNGFTSKKIR